MAVIPSKEDLVRLDQVIDSISLFVEVDSTEITARCSHNRRGPEAEVEREIERAYVRKSLAEKHATGMLMRAISGAGVNELAGYTFVAGYVVRNDELLKEVQYYLANALLTKWEHRLLAERKEMYQLPNVGLNSLFDPSRLLIFGFFRDQIARLLDRFGVKHSLLPKKEAFAQLADSLIGVKPTLPQREDKRSDVGNHPPIKLHTSNRRRGPVANLASIYETARRRAVDKNDFQSVKNEVLRMIEAKECNGLLIEIDGGLFEVLKNRINPGAPVKYEFKKLSNWLGRRTKEERSS